MPRSSVQTQYPRVVGHHVNSRYVLMLRRVFRPSFRANRKWIVSESDGKKWISPAKDQTGRSFPLVSSNNTLVRGAVLHSTSQ
jgi:hypothetical protein